MVELDPVLQQRIDASQGDWEAACAFADTLGAMPQSLTVLIRTLLLEEDSPDKQTSSINEADYTLARFFNSPSLKAVYFYCLSFLKPDRVGEEDEPFRKSDFLRSFSPPEHAALLAIIFVYRRARKLTTDRGDRKLTTTDHFEDITKYLQLGANLGWLVSNSLAGINPSVGLILGSYHWLGMIPFLLHDPAGFRSYILHLQKEQASAPDPEFEKQRWGCCSAQVGLLIFLRAGIGSAHLAPILRAAPSLSTAPPENEADQKHLAVNNWIRNLSEGVALPTTPLPTTFYLSDSDKKRITDSLTNTEHSKEYNWLNISKADLGPEETPQLFLDDSENLEEPPPELADFTNQK